MKKIKTFFKGVKKEIKRVRWPSRKHMVKFSVATIITIVFFAGFYYLVDIIIALIKTVFN